MSEPRVTGHGLSRPHSETGAEPISAEAASRRAAEAGIHLLAIPTPFAVGRVNTYLIEDEPLTLIDSGPNSGKALDELERGIESLGYSIEQIELVVLTHQHVDHCGLVEIVANRSGAEVAALDLLAPILADYSANAELDDGYAADLMLRHGIAEDVVTALRSVSQNIRAWGSRATVDRTLADGDRIELRDRTLEVQHRPGHSPTDTLLWDARRRILIGADHLIAHISSNPVISRPLDRSEQRPRALLAYIESMRRTRELGAEIVLAGHGDPITEPAALIDKRIAMHDRRARKLAELISRRPMTAHELARELWGEAAVTQAFLTLSEVIGHLDLLVERGRAREIDGEVVRFEAIES